MVSLADVVAQAQAATISVRVPLRGDLMAELESLNERFLAERVADQELNREPLHVATAERILAVQAEMAESEVEFRFRGIGRKPYRELLRAHPPTAEQKAEADDARMLLLFDPDTFPPALMAASCLAPQPVSVEGFQAIWDQWSEGQTTHLWRACMSVNQGSAETPPKSVTASVAVHASKLSSDTASL